MQMGMNRIDEIELLEDPRVPDTAAARAYRDMESIHRWLGDVRFVIDALRREPLPVRKVLDVGCGPGLVLHRISRALEVEALGVDVKPRKTICAPVKIIRANACRDSLPRADVAFCMNLCHHLSPPDVVRLIRNVSRSCRRFILLDLVRHPLPLALFRVFVAPLICRMDAEDGRRSIRRSYTAAEMRAMTEEALAGSPATFKIRVAPLWFRQVIDIRYRPWEYEGLRSAPLHAVEDACPGW
jgi:SAM-dependent methyltransferase